VKATAPADLRALPERSQALLNAIAAKYADALRRQACRIDAAIVPRLSRTAARPVGQRGVGQLGVKAALTAPKSDFRYTRESGTQHEHRAMSEKCH